MLSTEELHVLLNLVARQLDDHRNNRLSRLQWCTDQSHSRAVADAQLAILNAIDHYFNIRQKKR